jgi:hypothetical protein
MNLLFRFSRLQKITRLSMCTTILQHYCMDSQHGFYLIYSKGHTKFLSSQNYAREGCRLPKIAGSHFHLIPFNIWTDVKFYKPACGINQSWKDRQTCEPPMRETINLPLLRPSPIFPKKIKICDFSKFQKFFFFLQKILKIFGIVWIWSSDDWVLSNHH